MSLKRRRGVHFAEMVADWREYAQLSAEASKESEINILLTSSNNESPQSDVTQSEKSIKLLQSRVNERENPETVETPDLGRRGN